MHERTQDTQTYLVPADYSIALFRVWNEANVTSAIQSILLVRLCYLLIALLKLLRYCSRICYLRIALLIVILIHCSTICYLRIALLILPKHCSRICYPEYHCTSIAESAEESDTTEQNSHGRHCSTICYLRKSTAQTQQTLQQNLLAGYHQKAQLRQALQRICYP